MAVEENASKNKKSDDRCYTKCVLIRFIKLGISRENFHIRK